MAVYAQSTLTVTGAAAVTETDANAPITYTITRTGAEFAAATAVSVALTHGTATAADVTLAAASVTFAAGADSQTFTVTVIGDAINEAAESFTLHTHGGAGITHATSATAPLSVTITDNDALVAHVARAAGESGNVDEGGTATFTVTLRTGTGATDATGTSGGIICVPFIARIFNQKLPHNTVDNLDIALVAPNTGTCADRNTPAVWDVTNARFIASVLIPLGDSSANFSVLVRQDGIDDSRTSATEVREVFSIGLSPPVARSGAGSVSRTTSNTFVDINNVNPAPITLSLTAPAGNLTEGTAANFTVRFTESVTTTAAVTVDWTAAPAADFATATGTATIPAGQSSTTIAITPAADSLNEDDETFTVTLSNPAGGGTAIAPRLATTPTATATIAASDPITATVTGGGTVMEGGDATVTVNLGVTATTAVTVGYTIAPGTATAADYSDTSGGSITIASGESSGTVTIGITDDDDIEPAEMFTVTIAASDISGHIGTATGGGTQTFTIAASDAVGIAVAVDNATPSEGDTVTFTVTLSGGAAATVDWNITGDADDYGGNANGSLSFTTAGSRTVAVAITDDDIIEDAETLTFTLSNATGADITTAAATVTITDNDTLTVTISGPSNLNLNTTATYTVDLGGRVLRATTVTVTGVDDITIPAGERSGEFTIAAGNTERTLLLTATANGISGTLTVTITADDSAARGERATVPVASVAQSVGQLASSAIGKRLTFSGGNDFINQTSFALTAANSGINFWGSGGTLSANGEVNGTTYDADTTAWHIGADTAWGDGLLGIALARTDGETDFTAAGVAGKLETDITSVHPYAIRNWNDAKVWGTLGYGSGDAELTETDVFKSDLTILSLAGGVTVNAGRNLTFTTDAHWNRAELDGGNANGKVLPKVTADTTRINIAAQIAANFTDKLRPFATLAIRHDFGDGDTGGAADYGGGMEWNSQQIQARIEARSQAQGSGADEDHLSFTLRRTSGTGIAPYAQWNLNHAVAGARLERERFSLGMEVGVADSKMQFKNLLSGEVRF